MSGWQQVRPAVPGATRVVLAGGAAAALVWAATTHPFGVDLAAAGGVDDTPVSGTALTTSVAAMCPGDELTGIRGVPGVEVGGTVAAAAGPADLLPAVPTSDGAARLTAGPKKVLVTVPSERPSRASASLPAQGPVTLTATGAMAPAVAAGQEWRLTAKDVRGLVTTPCLAAGSDLWLLAGGDGAGRQERLVLLNPGGNPVTADVTVHGAAGQVGGVRTETVAPGGRTTLLLDAWAGAEKQPAVHVVADGGGLQATLTETWIAGSTPRGAETVVGTDAPGTVQVVPGALLGGGARLRVAVPGDEQAVVRVTVLGKDGLVPTTAESVLTVGSGATGELALPPVPPDIYTLVVRADVPVVAAVLATVGDGSAPGDIAWSGSAPAVTDVAGAALPRTASVTRSLHLVSTGGASTATVHVVSDSGDRTQTVQLVSERTTNVDLGGADAVWVQRTSGSGSLRGAVVSTSGSGADTLVSVMTLEPTAVTSPVSRAFPLP
jgi:hypothetical protein